MFPFQGLRIIFISVTILRLSSKTLQDGLSSMNNHFRQIKLEVRDHVALLTLNVPDNQNAYSPQMSEDLLDAWNECEDPQIHSIIMTGAGSAFCGGFDVKALKDSEEEAVKKMSRMTVYLHSVISTMRRIPKPIIAAVNGPADGAGFSLALAADFILASDQASFAMSYIQLGITPNGGSSYFLTRLVGPARAAELIMTGKTISARKAFEWGIVSGVVAHDNLSTESRALAQYFAQGPGIAFGRSKRLIEQANTKSLEDQLEEERHSMMTTVKSDDFKEGLQSFIDKKKAKFKEK